MSSKETYASRVKLAEPWEPEITLREEDKIIVLNMYCSKNGEIRQVRVSYDKFARWAFKGQLNKPDAWNPMLTEPVIKS